MKGYFVHFERKDQYGVLKKIAGQIKALRSFSDVEEINIELLDLGNVARIRSRFPFWGYGYDYTGALEKIVDPDYVYVRHTVVDQDYVGFYRELRKKYPQTKIVCELFTYPYDRDFYLRKSTWPLYLKEIMFRGQLKKYIDRIITLTKDDEIFGIKTIQTVNGIDLDAVPFVEPDEPIDDTIRLISVAVMQRQHGFDRLIEGMHRYYAEGGKRNILYTVVGNSVGGEVEKYKSLVEKYDLSSRVVFVGRKTGSELDGLIHHSDIGICSLGSYRSGVDFSSQIKSREYLANGIALLTGCRIDVIEGSSFPYYIEFPNDPSPIDMEKVIEFFDSRFINTEKSRSIIAHEIRAFAEKTVDIKKVMEPVHEYITRE